MDAAAANQEKTIEWYNSRARELPPLQIGQRVRLQDSVAKDWQNTGLIISVGRRRDYRVQLPNGKIYWRNRRFIRANLSSTSQQDTARSGPNDDMQPAADGSSSLTDQPDNSPPPPRRSNRIKKQKVQFDVHMFFLSFSLFRLLLFTMVRTYFVFVVKHSLSYVLHASWGIVGVICMCLQGREEESSPF